MGNGQWFRLVPLQPLSGLDPHVEFQLTVNSVNPLVVPAMALNVAQVKKAQAKTPGPARLCQTKKKISNPLVLLIQFGPVTITSLADIKRPAGK